MTANMPSEPEKSTEQRLTKVVVFATALSSLGGFLFGYDAGTISGAMVFFENDFHLDSLFKGIIVSVTIGSAWMATMSVGYFAEAFGRKRVVTYSAIIFMAGCIFNAFVWDKWALLAGRVVIGLACGASSGVTPMYVAEMAPTRIRGSLTVINFLFIVGGQLLAAIVASCFSYLPHDGWRFMLGCGVIPAAVQLIGLMFLPESPRWLVKMGRRAEALDALIRIRGHPDIEEEYNSIQEVCNKSEDKTQGCQNVMLQVLADRHLRKALFIGILLQVTKQLTAINTVMYYTATIIQMSGVYETIRAEWYTVAVVSIFFFCTMSGVYLVEKMGRRSLMLMSLFGAVIGLVIIALGFYLGQTHSPSVSLKSNSSTDAVCSSFSNCNSCAHSRYCGYCFYDEPENLDNEIGTCMTASVDSPNQRSVDGLCENGTVFSNSDSQKSLVWAKNWCPSDYSWLILLGLAIYLFFYGPGVGPLPTTIAAEIYPLWCRSACFATTISFAWFFNIFISLTFLLLTEALTMAGAFSLYAGFGAIGFVLLWIWLPETKGKSLEEIEQLFSKSSALRSV